MKNTVEQPILEEKLQKTEARVSELERKNAELTALVKYYEEQIRLSKHRQFGASSEKTNPSEQIGLFDEVETTAEPKAAEPELEQVVYNRRKRVGKRDEDLSKLPTETIEYELPEDEQLCPECGGVLHTMKREIRREIIIIPAQVKVVEHVRHVYACRACEKNNDHTPIVKANAPEPLIKGSVASASAVAQIIAQKYVNAVPLYRQEQDFLRNGFSIPRQNMANWVIYCAENWLALIYERMRETLLERNVLHADETVLQVLKEPGKKANTNSYMWLYRTSGDTEDPIVLYEYQPTRSSAHPKAFLKGFTGYLHTDGYQGYHCLPDITVVGCWAHARRKFDEACRATAKAVADDGQCKTSASQTGLDYCNRLFALESALSELKPEERYKKRLELVKPVADAFFCWAKSVGALPKSMLGKAISYALEQRPYLENFFLDGRLEFSNNRAERSIKPFVIGRKNWLFCNTPKGAFASSVVYSIIETAKENGLKPFEYLCFLLDKIPNASTNQLDSLLPWAGAIPDFCKIPKR